MNTCLCSKHKQKHKENAGAIALPSNGSNVTEHQHLTKMSRILINTPPPIICLLVNLNGVSHSQREGGYFYRGGVD